MNDLEDKIEEAFWSFDGRRKGYGEFKNRPQSERDAFKHEMRKIIDHIYDNFSKYETFINEKK